MVQHCSAQLYWFLLHRIALQCILYCSAQNFDFYCIVLHCNVFCIVLHRILISTASYCIAMYFALCCPELQGEEYSALHIAQHCAVQCEMQCCNILHICNAAIIQGGLWGQPGCKLRDYIRSIPDLLFLMISFSSTSSTSSSSTSSSSSSSPESSPIF